MVVYCRGCIYYGGRPSGDDDNDYAGDQCNHPSNIEYVDNYYSPETQRYVSHPASINEDNDCGNYSNTNIPEE